MNIKRYLFGLLSVVIILVLTSCNPNSLNTNSTQNNQVNDANIENANKGDADMNKVKLFYMGHASLRIVTEDNKVIYVDPFMNSDYSMPADLILETHDHFDHSALDKVANRNENCKIITEKEALANGIHNSFMLPYVRITSVEAGYNKNHDVNKCVGYVLEFNNGIKLYICGDTSKTKQMEDMSKMNIDYAFYCCDGVYNMDNDEAAECAKLVNAKHNIPYHNDTSDNGMKFDLEKAKAWTAPNKLIIEPGNEISLEK